MVVYWVFDWVYGKGSYEFIYVVELRLILRGMISSFE